MKVYSRRRKHQLLNMLESLLEKGDVLYLDDVKCLVAIDEVANKKYMILDNGNVIPYDRFFESYKNSEFLTDLFTYVNVKSNSNNVAAFFQKFFNNRGD